MTKDARCCQVKYSRLLLFPWPLFNFLNVRIPLQPKSGALPGVELGENGQPPKRTKLTPPKIHMAKTKVKIVTLFLAAMLSVSAYAAAPAWKEPDGFRELRWGSSVNDMIRTFPKASRAVEMEIGGRERVYKTATTIGAAPVYLYLKFLDGRFAAFTISFERKDAEQIKKAFLERYGAPHKGDAWIGKNVSIMISVSDGVAVVRTTEYIDYRVETEKKRSKQASKDL